MLKRIYKALVKYLPFYISTLLLAVMLIPGCPHQVKPPPTLDGGHFIKNDFQAYWEPENFPIEIIVSVDLPEHFTVDTELAVEAWNVTTGLDIFEITYMDFNQDLPEGCGWVAVVDKSQLETDGSWRGKYKAGTSKLCHGQVTLKTEMDPVAAHKVVIHELGHALGLAHDEADERSIMYPTVYTDVMQYIMPDDVFAVVRMVHGDFVPLPRSLKDEGDIRKILADL